MNRAIRIDEGDNVAVVIDDVSHGESVDVGSVRLGATEFIARGHKIALQPIPEGEFVVKYGIPIGRASAAIRPGEHIHVHNVEDITEALCEQYARAFRAKGGN